MTINNDATKFRRIHFGEEAEEVSREQKFCIKYCILKCNSQSLLLPCCVSKNSDNLWQNVSMRQPHFDKQSSLIVQQRLGVYGWNKTFLLGKLSARKLEMEEREDALSQRDKISMTELDPHSHNFAHYYPLTPGQQDFHHCEEKYLNLRTLGLI